MILKLIELSNYMKYTIRSLLVWNGSECANFEQSDWPSLNTFSLNITVVSTF